MNNTQVLSAVINAAFLTVDDMIYRLMNKLESLTPAPTYAEKMRRRKKTLDLIQG